MPYYLLFRLTDSLSLTQKGSHRAHCSWLYRQSFQANIPNLLLLRLVHQKEGICCRFIKPIAYRDTLAIARIWPALGLIHC